MRLGERRVEGGGGERRERREDGGAVRDLETEERKVGVEKEEEWVGGEGEGLAVLSWERGGEACEKVGEAGEGEGKGRGKGEVAACGWEKLRGEEAEK